MAILEPTPLSLDLYKRPMAEQPESVYVEGDTNTRKSWEVERVIDKEGDRYLVRWKGYGPAWDE